MTAKLLSKAPHKPNPTNGEEVINTFAVGATVVIILDAVIIAVLAGRKSDQDEAIERASYYDAELAFIEALPDGRDVAVFDRNLSETNDTPKLATT